MISQKRRQSSRLLYPYLALGNAAKGEGLNLLSVAAAVGIVALVGGWLAWAGGIGAKPLPSLRDQLIKSTDATIEITTPEKFGFGLIIPTASPTYTPSPRPPTFTPSPLPTNTSRPTLPPTATQTPTPTDIGRVCAPVADDQCLAAWVAAGMDISEYWSFWTPQMLTAVPTARHFITWTPSPQLLEQLATVQSVLTEHAPR